MQIPGEVLDGSGVQIPGEVPVQLPGEVLEGSVQILGVVMEFCEVRDGVLE